MADAVSRLKQIAAQLRQLPGSLDFDSPPNVERVAGDLLLEAIELGAFSGPEHADLLNRIRRAKLCSADYRRQVLYEFFGEGFRTDRPLSYGLLADAIEAEAAKLEALGKAGAETRRKRRRKVDPDLQAKRAARREREKADKRLWEAWAGGRGQFATLDELAREKGISKRDLQLALDRHRKKLERSGKRKSDKRPQ
jgi:hypothetical protein